MKKSQHQTKSTNQQINKSPPYLHNMPTNLVLFDGVCNLCNRSVQLLLKIDRKKRLLFGSLQSEQAQSILKQYGVNPMQANSILYIKDGKIFRESDAILNICKTIGGIWKIFYLFIFLPRFLRNPFYRLIARHRYQWFGKRQSCVLPTSKWKDRFIG